MSKNQQKQTFNAANTQESANNTNEATVSGQLNPILGTAQNNAAALLPSLTTGYSSLSQPGGGYNPAIMGTINSTDTNLATTGGITPEQVTSMQDQAITGAQSSFATQGAAAQRAQAATGGYGLSGSLLANLARGESQAAAPAITGVNASITGMQQAGEEAGAQQLNTVQQAQTGNQLQALSGTSNLYGLDINQATQTMNQILQNYQQTGQLNNQDLSILTQIGQSQPGLWGTIQSALGTVAGIAKGAATS
jgi:hypothetical protein